MVVFGDSVVIPAEHSSQLTVYLSKYHQNNYVIQPEASKLHIPLSKHDLQDVHGESSLIFFNISMTRLTYLHSECVSGYPLYMYGMDLNGAKSSFSS